MRRYVRFLLPFLLAAALADCSGGGSGQSGLPTTTTSAGAATASRGVLSTTPSGTYWAGSVSGVTGYGIVANCGQHNFAAGYGCLPVTTTGATISGSPIAGQYFQMWGDLSNLPNITATTINYGSSPFPATDPNGGSASAGTYASSTSGAFDGFANAADYTTSFTPYASTSIWRTTVSSNPTIASYSAAVISTQFPNGQNFANVRATEAGQYDYSHPRFFATSSDPVVNLQCTQYCGSSANGGVPAQAYIPAQARPAEGGDGHFDVVQPDGTEISMWAASQPSGNWTNGATVRAGNIANCGSIASGQGWLSSGPGPTAAGFCDDAGVVTAAELSAGQINHALFLIGSCAVGAQYPSQYGATTDRCTSGVGPPLGGREWYDVPCSSTQANGALHPWEKAILCALNQYGAYLGDDGGGGTYYTGGLSISIESEEPWYDYNGAGYTSPFAALASQGWTSIPISSVHGSERRWVGADPWQPSGVNFGAHMHWLAPCSAQGSC